MYVSKFSFISFWFISQTVEFRLSVFRFTCQLAYPSLSKNLQELLFLHSCTEIQNKYRFLQFKFCKENGSVLDWIYELGSFFETCQKMCTGTQENLDNRLFNYAGRVDVSGRPDNRNSTVNKLAWKLDLSWGSSNFSFDEPSKWPQIYQRLLLKVSCCQQSANFQKKIKEEMLCHSVPNVSGMPLTLVAKRNGLSIEIKNGPDFKIRAENVWFGNLNDEISWMA